MSSSTSSSEERRPTARPVPEGPWGATLALALVLFAGAVALVERAWRRYGLVPTVGDSLDLWSYERGRVQPLWGKPLMIVGGSRSLCDLDLDVMHERLPGYQIAQLSVLGMTPIATLRDLAADERLHDGTVLVTVAEHALERSRWDEQDRWVRHYHQRRTLTMDFDVHAAALLESELVTANPMVGLTSLIAGKMPVRDYATYGADRSCRADYGLVDAEKARAARTKRVREVYGQSRPPSQDAWLAQAKGVEVFVQELARRNVRVAFLRPPTTGDHWILDSARYPRDRYWDRFRAAISVPAIHFKDVPGLAQFDAPDGSHLDVKDIGQFTECLVDALVARGVVDADRAAEGSRCHVRVAEEP